MPAVDYGPKLVREEERIRSSDELSELDRETLLDYKRDLEVQGLSDSRIFKVLCHTRMFAERLEGSRAEDYLTLRYYFLFLTRRALDDEELARELDPILVELSQESWLDGEFYLTLSQILAVRHELDGEGNSNLSEEFLEERFEDLMERVDLKEAGRAKEAMMEHDRRRKEKKGESGEKDKNPMWD